MFNVHLMSYVLEWTVKTLSYIVNEYWVDYAHVHVIIWYFTKLLKKHLIILLYFNDV